MTSFASMWAELAPVGRDPATGGYHRPGWSVAERDLRRWFDHQCASRGLQVETDPIGNVVAWWRPDGVGAPAAGGVVTGSHLDSVPDGGAFDGPLGVVSALAAVDRLRDEGFVPQRPLGVAVFVEEEGSRFGLPCLGSRVATGGLDAERVLALRDRDGLSFVEALARAGAEVDPTQLVGAGRDWLAQVGAFVELHVEQGRWLAEPTAGASSPVGVATAIWPHGRWRLDVTGRADHAGTTRMQHRADPMLAAATAVLAAHRRAGAAGARATVGRVDVRPNATNAVPSAVSVWLDARAETEHALRVMVDAVVGEVQHRAGQDGTTVGTTCESTSPRVDFDPPLRDRVAATIGGAVPCGPAGSAGAPAPLLPTQAGHDAGVLAAAGVPTAMLFVRNPTGVSHSPAETASLDDCEAGVQALAAVLADLAGSAPPGDETARGVPEGPS